MDKTGAVILILIGVAGVWLYDTGRLGGIWQFLSSPSGSVVIAQAPAAGSSSSSGMVCTTGG
jgi:hypothetical protein